VRWGDSHSACSSRKNAIIGAGRWHRTRLSLRVEVHSTLLLNPQHSECISLSAALLSERESEYADSSRELRRFLENLALRQQLAVLRLRHPRPRFKVQDKLFWVALRWWSGWKRTLIVVTPETVVRWHRAGFRLYWTWLSRHQVRTGRKRVSREVRELIFRMLAENPTWGAPRIHGELQMLGFDLSERTVSRWIQRAPRNPEPAKRWLTFLRNHRELIAAMDFFTVPTFTFGVLYCFFVVAHDRRRILHFNVTRTPTSSWVVQQLREAFPYDSTHKYLIFDRDAKFGFEVIEAVKAFGSKPVRTSFRLAERCCRTLGGELSTRPARSCDRAQCEALEATLVRLRALLS
jgi:hypothetical protein